jgi:type I restriction enzyme S subunit
MKVFELQEVCEVIAGQSPPSDSYNQSNKGIPFFQGKADFGDLYPSVRYWCFKPTKISLPNDILFSVRAPVGPTNINNTEACIGRGLSALRCKDDKIIMKYLLHYIRANEKRISNLGTGSTFKAITISELKKIQIPLPPLEDQKKIAAILDAADVYRQKTKALLAKYDELTQSLFLDMFGDTKTNPKQLPIKSLEELCDEIIDCPHSTPNYVECSTDFPCIRTTELDNGAINWSKMKYLDYEGYIERTRRLVPKEGDIIYGREGSFGEAAIVPADCKMSLGQRVMLFRPNSNLINSKFLHAVVRSNGVYQQALRVTSGSTVGHINVKDIKKFKLIVAPLVLQNQFEERVQAVEQQKAQAQASLEKAEELFNSLLQRAFKGELI